MGLIRHAGQLSRDTDPGISINIQTLTNNNKRTAFSIILCFFLFFIKEFKIKYIN